MAAAKKTTLLFCFAILLGGQRMLRREKKVHRTCAASLLHIFVCANFLLCFIFNAFLPNKHPPYPRAISLYALSSSAAFIIVYVTNACVWRMQNSFPICCCCVVAANVKCIHKKKMQRRNETNWSSRERNKIQNWKKSEKKIVYNIQLTKKYLIFVFRIVFQVKEKQYIIMRLQCNRNESPRS